MRFFVYLSTKELVQDGKKFPVATREKVGFLIQENHFALYYWQKIGEVFGRRKTGVAMEPVDAVTPETKRTWLIPRNKATIRKLWMASNGDKGKGWRFIYVYLVGYTQRPGRGKRKHTGSSPNELRVRVEHKQ